MAAAVIAPAVLAIGGAPVRYYPSIAAHEGRLYTQIDRGAYVAIDLATRSVAWRFNDPHLRIFTKPTFYHRSLVVAASAATGSEVLSITDGRLDWRTHFGDLGRSSGPVLCGERVLVGDWLRGQVQALEIASGRGSWTKGGHADYFFHPPAARGDHAFYVVAHRAALLSWSIAEIECATGAVLNTIHVQDGVGGSNYPIVLPDSRAILISYEPHTGTDVAAFELDAKVVAWRLHLDDAQVVANAPIVEDDNLVLAEGGLWVIGLGSGTVTFHRDMRFAGVAPALVKGSIVLQTGTNKLTAIDLGSHRTVWEASLPGGIVSDLIRVGGVVYVRLDGDRLLQIDPADGKVVNSLSLRLTP